MLNILTLISIYLNFALYSSSFLFAKLPEDYALFNPIVDVMPVIPILFFLLPFCLASCCKFSIKCLTLSYILDLFDK